MLVFTGGIYFGVLFSASELERECSAKIGVMSHNVYRLSCPVCSDFITMRSSLIDA